MENIHYDPRSSEEINFEYVDKVHRFPEHLAVCQDSPSLKNFHMNLITVSFGISQCFFVSCGPRGFKIVIFISIYGRHTHITAYFNNIYLLL